MCGISAIISFEESDIVSNIFNMTKLVRHRGPDDEGYAVFGGNPADIRIYGGDDTPESVYGSGLNYTPTQKHPTEVHGKLALGHRRLSIIDLSAKGHQPMSYKNGRYWIVYNGEIYNYIEIRAELVKKGHCFVSGTDTEVILAAYDEWGEDCLNHFNGMWAFVIYDTIGEKVFAARDRFGVKPFFFWKSPAGLYAIASEIKQFTVLPGWSPKINESKLSSFLFYGIRNHSETTMFKDVYELCGGHYFNYDFKKNEHSIIKWYDLNDKISFSKIDFEEASLKFRDIFTSSIDIRLRSDVKVGSCLSGGLDSSAIVCVANDLLRMKGKQDIQETVSCCFPEKIYNEEEYIDEVVNDKSVINHKIIPDMDSFKHQMDYYTWIYDEPIPTSNMYAQFKVFEEAKKKGLIVMLDGQGGDELFAGYHYFFNSYLRQLFFNRKFKSLFSEIMLFSRNQKLSVQEIVLKTGKSFFPKSVENIIRKLSGRDQHTWIKWNGDEEKIRIIKDDIAKMSIAYITSLNLPMLLHFEDRNSMAHSVESRTPFLDYRLVEFAINLPDEFKISKGQTKYIMRESLVNTVPGKILSRHDKMGFVTPEDTWIYNDAEFFKSSLKDACEFFGNLLDSSKVIERFNLDLNKKNILPGSIYWRIIIAHIWAKRFSLSI